MVLCSLVFFFFCLIHMYIQRGDSNDGLSVSVSIHCKQDSIEKQTARTQIHTHTHKEISFQHTRKGRLRAMCLWSPAEPRLLNQSAGCDRLTGREMERVACAVLCVCACVRMRACVYVCAFSLGENKRCEIETKRQIDQLMQTQKNTAVSSERRGETETERDCSRTCGEWEGGRGEPSFLWLSQAGVVGLGWLRTLGFTIKAKEREREKKITVKK